MSRFLILIVALPQVSSFLFGGGCCQAPVMQSPCGGGCGATSWAYAPPQVIGYERIPLYAKVPMPAPPQYIIRSRPVPRVIQSESYYPPAPPPPSPPPAYNNQNTYYPPPMDNFASGPSSPSVSSVSNPIPSVIPPPQDKYDDGDVIIIETDDSRRRRMSSLRKFVQPPPSGYVSQPVAPQGYQQQPQQQFGGQVEQGIEVTPDQIASGYQPQQQGQFGGADQIPSQYGSQESQYGAQGASQGSLYGNQGASQGAQFASQGAQFGSQAAQSAVDTVGSSSAFESAGIAPSARRLRKFKN